MSAETSNQEHEHTAKLSNKHCGDLAEMIFMRKAASIGFSVSKPWADSERYDFVVGSGKVLWRVQVKSVRAKAARRPHYRVALAGSGSVPYTADDIDFLVAYIFPEDTWYVFPVFLIANRAAFCVTPMSKRSPFEKYREAWDLMERCTKSIADQPSTGNDQGGAPKA
jgi:PD-(D/E)XK endonuclease